MNNLIANIKHIFDKTKYLHDFFEKYLWKLMTELIKLLSMNIFLWPLLQGKLALETRR